MFLERKRLFAPVKGEKYMSAKEEYIEKIAALLQVCDDIKRLDFIYQLLQKSQQAWQLFSIHIV